MAAELRCKECGETNKSLMQLDPSGRYFTCKQCGTVNQIFDEWIINEVKVEVKGLQSAEECLTRADQYLEDRNFDAASAEVKKALALSPENHRAWWLRYCIEMAVAAYYNYEDQYGNSGTYTKVGIIADNLNKYAYRAIQYAPADVAAQYERAIASDEQFVLQNQNAKPEKPKASRQGCYIATAVYGSYQAPEVMVLRRYRDGVLRSSALGRAFIRVYYALSPKLAERLRGCPRLNAAVRRALDRFINRLEPER